MKSQPSSSIITWKLLFCVQSLIIVVLYTHYQYSQRTPRFLKNVTNTSPVVLNTTTTTSTPMKNVTQECCETQKLLEKCSTSEFVSLRAKTRIASDKNAVFGQGDRVINLGGNYFISVDDILFGYDMLFEADVLFSAGQWLGAQFQSSPPDAMVLQQLIWKIKPDLIIDFGTNVGGSALFFASIMSFYSDTGAVLTIDIKPFSQNWVDRNRVICKDCVNPSENKLWKKYVQFIQGSTTDGNVIAKIKQFASNFTKVFFSHDSSHALGIVYQDLINYAELVSVGSYLVVQDTKLDRLSHNSGGPLTAVRRFLDYQSKTVNRANYTFEVDRSVEIFYYTQHAHGWLKRIK
jgi:cephalosporin hydroxylase